MSGMEALIVFDPNNHPIISECNDQFYDVLSQLCLELKLSDGCSVEKVRQKLVLNETEYENVIILIFAPYVTSLRYFKNRSNFSNLFTQHVPNTRTKYSQYLDHTILFISNSENSRNLRYSEQNHYYFTEIIKLIFGSNPSSAKLCEPQKLIVKSLYKKWNVSRNEPSFVFEASERLLVTSNIFSNFTLILQAILNKSRELLSDYGEVPSHSFLMINGKMVCQFFMPSAHRLSKKDYILLQLLHDYSFDFSQDISMCSEAIDYEKRIKGKLKHTSSIEDKHQSSSENQRLKSNQVIFLESPKDHRMLHGSIRKPFCIRFIRITHSFVLMIISELFTGELATNLHMILDTLNKILFYRQDLNGFFDFHRLVQSVSYVKKTLENSRLKNARQLILGLENLMKSDLKKYCLELDHQKELPSQLDALCSAVCGSLRNVYHERILKYELDRLNRVCQLEKVQWSLMLLESFCFRKSSIYLDYIEVKSNRNMTIDPFTDLIPGLKIFSFVDRRHNLLIHASSSPENYQQLSEAFLDSRQSLAQGDLKHEMSTRHLHFYYYIWFEDLKGNVVSPDPKEFTLRSYPSIMGEDFIQELHEKCFVCSRGCICSKEPIRTVEMIFAVDKKSDQDMWICARRLSNRLNQWISPDCINCF